MSRGMQHEPRLQGRKEKKQSGVSCWHILIFSSDSHNSLKRTPFVCCGTCTHIIYLFLSHIFFSLCTCSTHRATWLLAFCWQRFRCVMVIAGNVASGNIQQSFSYVNVRCLCSSSWACVLVFDWQNHRRTVRKWWDVHLHAQINIQRMAVWYVFIYSGMDGNYFLSVARRLV